MRTKREATQEEIKLLEELEKEKKKIEFAGKPTNTTRKMCVENKRSLKTDRPTVS